MSSSNGVVRIGRKGLKKFAFGEDGAPFEVDVVTTVQEWIGIYQQLQGEDGLIANEVMPTYHQSAVAFTERLSGCTVTVAEALDFLARLREQYDSLADFFQPKSREERASPATSAQEMRFSVEENSTPSVN